METLTRTLKFVSEEGFFFHSSVMLLSFLKAIGAQSVFKQDISPAVLLPSPTQPQGAVAARPEWFQLSRNKAGTETKAPRTEIPLETFCIPGLAHPE